MKKTQLTGSFDGKMLKPIAVIKNAIHMYGLGKHDIEIMCKMYDVDPKDLNLSAHEKELVMISSKAM